MIVPETTHRQTDIHQPHRPTKKMKQTYGSQFANHNSWIRSFEPVITSTWNKQPGYSVDEIHNTFISCEDIHNKITGWNLKQMAATFISSLISRLMFGNHMCVSGKALVSHLWVLSPIYSATYVLDVRCMLWLVM